MFGIPFFETAIAFSGTIIGLTEIAKRALKLGGVGPPIASVIISSVVTIPTLQSGIIPYLATNAFAILGANGLFKAFHTPKRQ